jgi:2-polyprenyl-3-methyl-5-hydroxy-6-metoxy-1,4-benzoquinol methylase
LTRASTGAAVSFWTRNESQEAAPFRIESRSVGGKMFVIGEGTKPTEESSKSVSQFAEQIISCFRDVAHPQWYYDTHKARIAFDLDYADRFLRPSDRVLEVGAFPYLLTLPLISKNYDVTALDKCSSLEYLPGVADKFKVKVIDCDLDIDRIPENDGSFDCVIMNEVFEHLRINLIASMREVCRVLRPRGVLLLSTPNLRSVRGINNLLRRQEAYSSWGGIYDNYSHLEKTGIMGHVREYTSKEVTDFLQKIGFEVDGAIYRGTYSEGWFWKLAQQFTRLQPQFKPYFSIVAHKR